MEPQLQQHTHDAREEDDQGAPLSTDGHQSGHEYSEEPHGEKKSIRTKVKEKAKRLKNTIKNLGHGHGGSGHGHDNNTEDDVDEEDMEEETVVRGSPKYESPRVGQQVGGPDAISAQPRGNVESPTSEVGYSAPPQALGEEEEEVNPQKLRGKIGTPTGMEEEPSAPLPTLIASSDPPMIPEYPDGKHGSGQDPILAEPASRGNLEEDAPPQPLGQEVNPAEKWSSGKIGTPAAPGTEEEDPHPTMAASPDQSMGTGYVVDSGPELGNKEEGSIFRGITGKSSGMEEVGSVLASNYDETKVTTDPAHDDTGGKEAEVSQIQDSLGKMGIRDKEEDDSGLGLSELDHNDRPETNPPQHADYSSVTGNPSSWTDKSPSTAASDQAAVAKEVEASKLGYSGNTSTTTEPHGTEESPAADYENVVDAAGSPAVMSKVQGSVSGGTAGEAQVEMRGCDDDMSTGPAAGNTSEADKEVLSMKEYLLKPAGEEADGKALLLSDDGETENKYSREADIAKSPAGAAADYAYKNTDTASPVNEKQVQESVSAGGQPQVEVRGSGDHISTSAAAAGTMSEADNKVGVPVKPGEEAHNKALLDGETDNKSREEEDYDINARGPTVVVTDEQQQSVEQLGSTTDHDEQYSETTTTTNVSSPDDVNNKGVTERFTDMMGSWFGTTTGNRNVAPPPAPGGSLGTSSHDDEALSTTPTADHKTKTEIER